VELQFQIVTPKIALMSTSELAAFVVDTDNIPAGITDRLRDLLLDHIGLAARGARHAESNPAVHAAIERLDPAGGAATVIGRGGGRSAPYAALLNGYHAHSLDFDDTNRAQTGHPGAPVIAAAMAEAEDWRSYDRIKDPDLVAMMSRITAAEGPAAASLIVHIGETKLATTVRIPYGEPENWLGPEMLRHKFLGLTESVYGPTRAAEIADRVLALRTGQSMRDLVLTLRPGLS
jgi:2-methylcitrate dehydratase PrpD